VELNLTLVIQVLNFLIVVGVLSLFLYRPLTKFLDKRSQYIKDLIDKTEAAREESSRNLEESKRGILEAQKEACKIKEMAKEEASAERKEIIEKARKEAEGIVLEAKEEMNRELERAKKALQREVATLAIDISEKILSKPLIRRLIGS